MQHAVGVASKRKEGKRLKDSAGGRGEYEVCVVVVIAMASYSLLGTGTKNDMTVNAFIGDSRHLAREKISVS